MALAESATVTPERRAGIRGHIFAVSIALIGGLLGIVGAMIQELRAGGFLLLPFLGAPIIEEGLKPLGVYILLIRWPHLLRGRLYTALLAALAGLTFGTSRSTYPALRTPSSSIDSRCLCSFTRPAAFLSASALIRGCETGL